MRPAIECNSPEDDAICQAFSEVMEHYTPVIRRRVEWILEPHRRNLSDDIMQETMARIIADIRRRPRAPSTDKLINVILEAWLRLHWDDPEAQELVAEALKSAAS